ETEVALEVSAPAQASQSQLPLNARFQGKYHAATGELEVTEFNANTQSSQVHASGTLSSHASLKLSVRTTNLREWQPLIVAFRGQTQIPVTLHGSASFNGAASGGLAAITVAGNLQVQDFDFLVPPTAHTPEKQVHWDSMTADLQLSRSG